MLKEILKPRSYNAAQLVKEGEYLKGGFEITTATFLRTMIAYGGIRLAGIEPKTGLKAAIVGNLAITAGVFGYYLLE